jgi:exodeoxyribonuclease VII small subunit
MCDGAPVSEPAAVPPATSYVAAVAELEAILRALEEDDLDVDALASNVARAADLLRWCRSRIIDTQMQVEHIVADLEVDDLPPT